MYTNTLLTLAFTALTAVRAAPTSAGTSPSGSWTLYGDESCSISLESTANFKEDECYIVSEGFQAAYYVGPPSETEGLLFYPTFNCTGEAGSASGFYLGCAKNGFTAYSAKYVSSA